MSLCSYRTLSVKGRNSLQKGMWILLLKLFQSIRKSDYQWCKPSGWSVCSSWAVVRVTSVFVRGNGWWSWYRVIGQSMLFLQLLVCVCVMACVSVSVIHTTVAGLRSISSSNFTICCMSLALERMKPVSQSFPRRPVTQFSTRHLMGWLLWFIGDLYSFNFCFAWYRPSCLAGNVFIW